jgi:hypothetical protein
MSKSRELFDAFVESERYRFTDKDNNVFGLSVYQITRYYEFLAIILERQKQTSAVYARLLRQTMRDASAGSGSATPEELQGLKEQLEYMTLIQLEVESFYLFAKILLDRTAHFIELFFGPARKLSLDSHDQLTKRIETYCSQKQLALPNGLIEMMRGLKTDVSDHRDYRIAHEKSPRTVRGMFVSEDGRLSMTYNRVFPTDSDKHFWTKPLRELFGNIDKYLIQIVAFAEENKDKTRFELKSASQ